MCSRGRVRRRARQKLYAKTVVAFALWALSYGSLMFAHPGVVARSAVPRGPRVRDGADRLLRAARREPRRVLRHAAAEPPDGLDVGRVLGFSSYAWRVKHNVAHHTYTNVDGYDDDINQAPFARLTPNQAPKRWYRLQHIYIWPLYSLMVLRWQTGADVAALVRGRIGSSPIRPPRRWALAGLIGGKAIFIALGDRRPALRLPVVGGRDRLPRRSRRSPA